MFLNVCENSNFLSLILLLKNVINIISIIVPIALIIMIGIDVFKMVVSSDGEAFKSMPKSIIKRSIAAVAVFFIPVFVNLLLSLLNRASYNSGNCWTNAERITISYYRSLEKAREEVEKQKREQEMKEAEENRKALAELREHSNSSGGNIGSGEITQGIKYNLTEQQLIALARVCRAEQGSVTGAAAEASLMANLLERNNKSGNGDDLYKYVRTSGWFAHAEDHMDNGTYTPEILAAVRDVLVNGNRTLPSNVVEHDCWFCNSRKCSTDPCNNGNKGDICKIIVNGRVLTSEADIKNRNNYIKDETIIYNVYGSIYKFYTFPSERADPFGYIVGYY